jgi:hypothetical protein
MIEINSNFVEASTTFQAGETGGLLMITPPIDENYFIARVPLFKDQAIVIFPKFGTIGCGFAKEAEDWNTNLPLSTTADRLYEHIKVNKHYDEITDEQCIAAIRELQEWRKKQIAL